MIGLRNKHLIKCVELHPEQSTIECQAFPGYGNTSPTHGGLRHQSSSRRFKPLSKLASLDPNDSVMIHILNLVTLSTHMNVEEGSHLEKNH